MKQTTNIIVENTATAVAGGIATVLVNAYAVGSAAFTSGPLLFWGFVTGVLITSTALVVGKVVVRFTK